MSVIDTASMAKDLEREYYRKPLFVVSRPVGDNTMSGKKQKANIRLN